MHAGVGQVEFCGGFFEPASVVRGNTRSACPATRASLGKREGPQYVLHGSLLQLQPSVIASYLWKNKPSGDTVGPVSVSTERTKTAERDRGFERQLVRSLPTQDSVGRGLCELDGCKVPRCGIHRDRVGIKFFSREKRMEDE